MKELITITGQLDEGGNWPPLLSAFLAALGVERGGADANDAANLLHRERAFDLAANVQEKFARLGRTGRRGSGQRRRRWRWRESLVKCSGDFDRAPASSCGNRWCGRLSRPKRHPEKQHCDTSNEQDDHQTRYEPDAEKRTRLLCGLAAERAQDRHAQYQQHQPRDESADNAPVCWRVGGAAVREFLFQGAEHPPLQNADQQPEK